jgi:hypothetical protein
MNWDGIISLLFFSVESILLVNVLYFSRKVKVAWEGIAVIAILAFYQLMEYLVCGLELKDGFMAYLAFAAISFLPPLGLLFIGGLLRKRLTYYRIFLIPPVFFTIYYLFNIAHFEVERCTILYAAYNYPLGDIFGLFYYLPVLISIILLFSAIKSKHPLLKKNSMIMLLGYIFVSIPVVTAFILKFAGNTYLLNIIESVMCKFAVVLAVCYALVILNLSREILLERNNS